MNREMAMICIKTNTANKRCRGTPLLAPEGSALHVVGEMEAGCETMPNMEGACKKSQTVHSGIQSRVRQGCVILQILWHIANFVLDGSLRISYTSGCV